jgi:hypothetical protein
MGGSGAAAPARPLTSAQRRVAQPIVTTQAKQKAPSASGLLVGACAPSWAGATAALQPQPGAVPQLEQQKLTQAGATMVLPTVEAGATPRQGGSGAWRPAAAAGWGGAAKQGGGRQKPVLDGMAPSCVDAAPPKEPALAAMEAMVPQACIDGTAARLAQIPMVPNEPNEPKD